MSTELAIHTPLADRMTYARTLAEASLLPTAYRKQPANVLLALEYADALGISPIAAIQSVHIIDGKPSASAQLIGALVRRAGHRLRVVVSPDGQAAKATIVRSDDPDFTFESVWTMDRAVAAGLAGKGTWKSYPTNLLKARAITEVARDACPEALSGVSYTPEELGADEQVHAERVEPAEEPPVERVRPSEPVDDDWTTVDEDGVIVDADIVEPGRTEDPHYTPTGRLNAADTAPATPAQLKTVTRLCVSQHISHPVLAEFTAAKLGFDMPDTTDLLSKAQASAIISALSEVKA
jgi:hypothetical protein